MSNRQLAPLATGTEPALERNRAFAAAGGHQGAVVFISQIAENALPDGPLSEVAVIHHSQCGTGALADDTFRHRYAGRIGVEESILRRHAVLDPAATVTHDVELLRSAPAISPRVRMSGHVYDVGTGFVETVIPAGRWTITGEKE